MAMRRDCYCHHPRKQARNAPVLALLQSKFLLSMISLLAPHPLCNVVYAHLPAQMVIMYSVRIMNVYCVNASSRAKMANKHSDMPL